MLQREPLTLLMGERETEMRPFKVLDRWKKSVDKDLKDVQREQKEMRARLSALEKRRQVMRREYNA
jgi:hypothetical protein